MGNKTSTWTRRGLDTPRDQTDDHNEDDFSCGGLSARDAWDIALTWRQQIQGCVRLETDAHKAQFCVVPSFEWVTFVFDGSLSGGLKEVVDVDQTVAAARASIIVWYALSRCTGFGIDENPTFWRRLFSELYFPEYPKDDIVLLKHRADRPQLPITDAVRFFSDTAKSFPRVCIVPKQNAEEACIREFFSSTYFDQRLSKALESLQPHVIPSISSQRAILVSIEGVEVEKLARIVCVAGIFEKEDKPLMGLDWQLQYVFVQGNELQQSSAIFSILTNTPANIVVRKCESWNLLPAPRQSASSLITPFDVRHGQNRRTRVYLLQMSDSGGYPNTFPAICSSLPFATVADSIDMSLPTHRGRVYETIRTSDWAWLGYTLFHPNAAAESSSCCLAIDLAQMTDSSLDALEKMAIGNNLLSTIDGSKTCIGYHLGRIHAGTSIRADPVESANMIAGFEIDTWVTLSVQASESATTTRWVRVIVPGFGFGWIHPFDILEIITHTSLRSCVKRLRVTMGGAQPNGASHLTRLLSLLGDGLEHLDIQGKRPFGLSQMQSISYQCPSLKSLFVHHDGSFWVKKEVTAAPRSSKLEELGLYCLDGNARLYQLSSPLLENMRMFRIVSRSRTSSFAINQKMILGTLVRYPGLTHVSWSNNPADPTWWKHIRYDERKRRSDKYLSKLRRGVHGVTQGPTRLDSKLGFMSVVRSKGTSAIGCLGPDVCRNIFSFSTSFVPREIHVEEDDCTEGIASW